MNKTDEPGTRNAEPLSNEARFRAVLETSPDGFVMFAIERDAGGKVTDFRFTFANDAAAEQLGVPREELLGLSVRDVLLNIEGSPFMVVAIDAANSDETKFVSAFYAENGRHGWYRIHATRVGDEIAVVSVDISARKRVEESLALLDDVAKAVVSSLDEQSALGALVEVLVPKLADICCVLLREPGGSLRLVAAADDRAEVLENLRKLLSERGLVEGLAHGPLHVVATGKSELLPVIGASSDSKDDAFLGLLRQIKCSSWMTVPLQIGGKTEGVIGIGSRNKAIVYSEAELALAREIARRASSALENIRLYEQAQASNRYKDEFLAVISHELRTPLTAIAGWATMLRAGRASDPAMLKKGLEVIDRNVKAQTKIIEQILDASRIITSSLTIERQPLRLEEIGREAIASARPLAEAKGLSLRVRGDTLRLPISGDPERLRQAIGNLLSNAIKFTPQGGQIEVAFAKEAGMARIWVSDNGRGIAAAFLPQLFQRFRQADSSKTRRFGGLGMGLAIARHLVELHDGSLEALSEGEGRGSTFILSLPLDPRDEDERLGPESTPSANVPAHLDHPLAGLSVLLLEDQDDARELLVDIIESAGASVASSPDAERALAMLDERTFSVVVSDISMPDHDGFWFLSEVRKRSPRLPVLGLSAYVAQDDIAHAREAGFDDYLTKPVEAEGLVLAIARAAARQ